MSKNKPNKNFEDAFSTVDSFDFGFTTMSEEELEPVKNHELEKTAQVEEFQMRLQMMYDSILPLLNNLDNDEKEYIYWPNRSEKIEAFRKKLNKIYGGNIEDL